MKCNLSHLRTIIIEGTPLKFYYGSSFLMVFVCGLSDLLAGKVHMNFCLVLNTKVNELPSVFAGLTLMCIQRVDGMKYVSTFFELDFDTPWDHKILKASQFSRSFLGINAY